LILNGKVNVDDFTQTQLRLALGPFISYRKKWDPFKNSQAVKTGAALKNLGEKSSEIKGGSKEMTTKI